MEWLADNWVATLSIVLSSVALLLHLLRYRHDVNKSRVRLAVKFRQVASRAEIENEISDTEELEPWRGKKSLYERYEVIVTNTGDVDAFIGNVGVSDKRGRQVSALVRRWKNDTIVCAMSETDGEVISPKASQNYTVYHKLGQDFMDAKKAFVIDQTGQVWKSKHRI